MLEVQIQFAAFALIFNVVQHCELQQRRSSHCATPLGPLCGTMPKLTWPTTKCQQLRIPNFQSKGSNQPAPGPGPSPGASPSPGPGLGPGVGLCNVVACILLPNIVTETTTFDVNQQSRFQQLPQSVKGWATWGGAVNTASTSLLLPHCCCCCCCCSTTLATVAGPAGIEQLLLSKHAAT